MSGIQVPGQPRRGEAANPLLVLAAAADKTNQHLTGVVLDLGVIATHLKAIVKNTAKEDRHIYAIGRRDESTWGTYCLACSELAQEYVYPCLLAPQEDRPPSHITILPSVPDLIE